MKRALSLVFKVVLKLVAGIFYLLILLVFLALIYAGVLHSLDRTGVDLLVDLIGLIATCGMAVLYIHYLYDKARSLWRGGPVSS